MQFSRTITHIHLECKRCGVTKTIPCHQVGEDNAADVARQNSNWVFDTFAGTETCNKCFQTNLSDLS